MGDFGACGDNAVAEGLFGRLKHDWLLKIAQLTRKNIKQDVVEYMRHNNTERLHSAGREFTQMVYEHRGQ